MATITANKALDIPNIKFDFDFLSSPTIISDTQIGGITSSGQLQIFSGTFNLLAIALGDYSTSTVTGFRQYEGDTESTPLEYELTDFSIKGDVLADFLEAGDDKGLTAFILKEDDAINGSSENDVLLSFQGDDVILANDGDDAADGAEGDDELYGGKGNDTLAGGSGNDSIYAGNDVDVLLGLDGNDLLVTGSSADLAVGGAGDDTLYGGKGGDTLDGQSGSDTFFAGAGNDLMNGGDDDDWLKDGKGSDTITGGSGADTFAVSAGVDIITDFTIDQDDRILIDTAIMEYDYTDSGDDVVVLLTPTVGSSFEGGTTTLLNVDFDAFMAAESDIFITTV